MKAIEFDKRVCGCGNTAFYMMERTFVTGQKAVGLYCSVCGQWQKWMNRKDRSRFEAICYKMENNIN